MPFQVAALEYVGQPKVPMTEWNLVSTAGDLSASHPGRTTAAHAASRRQSAQKTLEQHSTGYALLMMDEDDKNNNFPGRTPLDSPRRTAAENQDHSPTRKTHEIRQPSGPTTTLLHMYKKTCANFR